MHELGIISAMLRTIEDIAKKEGLVNVEKIVIQVGQLSGAVPSYMEDCYPAAVYKTFFEKTKLELEIVPGTVRCNCCAAEFNAVETDLVCPNCNGKSLEVLGGRELVIKEIFGN